MVSSVCLMLLCMHNETDLKQFPLGYSRDILQYTEGDVPTASSAAGGTVFLMEKFYLDAARLNNPHENASDTQASLTHYRKWFTGLT